MKKLLSAILLLLALSSIADARTRPYNHCTITWYGKLYCSPHIND
ncbi:MULTISPECIES: hypothetical protein [unclassified Campylobacter]